MKKKILIVDDEPNIVMPLEYAFRKRNFDVFVARNGIEALEIAKKEIPNIILLDIMMPKLDGYETLKRLRQQKILEQTKVVLISVKSQRKDEDQKGADGYITKPFSIKKVVNDLDSIMV